MSREVLLDEHGDVLAATCVDEPLTPQGRAALAALARVARERLALTPEQEQRQAAARRRNHERNQRFAAKQRARVRRMHTSYSRRNR